MWLGAASPVRGGTRFHRPFLLQVIAIRPTRRILPLPGMLEDEEEEEDNDDIVMLEKKIRTSHMPEQAHKVCVKEIRR